MAGGFRSVAPWLGRSAPVAGGGYITLPWWQAGGGSGPVTQGGYRTLPWWGAGGGVGTDPVVEVVHQRGGRTRREDFKKLKLQLKEQYDKEIEQLLANLIIEEGPTGLSIDFGDVASTLLAAPKIETVPKSSFRREILLRQVQRERALRRFEEELAALLVMAHLLE